MGQSNSSENVIPDTVDNIQEEICRQARVFTELATLTYEDFQACLGQLNSLSKQCTDPNGKQLVFAVKKGTDSTLLWKGTVRIACVKMDSKTRKIDTYRLLNLSEFLKIFQTLRLQLVAAQQSSSGERSSSRESADSRQQTVCGGGENLSYSSSSGSTSTSSVSSRLDTPQLDLKLLTATLLLEEVDSLTCKPGERLNECCICLERKPDVMLPCAHSYCLPCIEQWNVNNKTCPICRETLDSTDDTWVISEVPGSQEISESICNSLLGLASTSKTSSH